MGKLTAGNRSLQKKDSSAVAGAPAQTSLDASRGQDLAKAGALTGHIYLLVDSSASMRKGDKVKQAQMGAIKFAHNALDQGYYTGLIQFDTSPTLVCEPGQNIKSLEKAVSGIKPNRSTHMAKAIKLAHSLLVSKPGMRVIVIITDGLPNGEGDPNASILAAEETRKAGIFIMAIGTDDANTDFLKRLASRFDLGMKIDRNQLANAIMESSRMLPAAKQQDSKNG